MRLDCQLHIKSVATPDWAASALRACVCVCVTNWIQEPWRNVTVFTVSVTQPCVYRYESGQHVIAVLTQLSWLLCLIPFAHTHFGWYFHTSTPAVMMKNNNMCGEKHCSMTNLMMCSSGKRFQWHVNVRILFVLSRNCMFINNVLILHEYT